MINYKIVKDYGGQYYAEVRKDGKLRSSFYGSNLKEMQNAVKIIWIRLKTKNFN